MLNILRKKKNNLFFKDISSINSNYTNPKKQNTKIQNKYDKDEYKNIIYYPSSSKE